MQEIAVFVEGARYPGSSTMGDLMEWSQPQNGTWKCRNAENESPINTYWISTQILPIGHISLTWSLFLIEFTDRFN